MTKVALVTGAGGQDGRYLVDLLLARGYVVYAQSRTPRECPEVKNLNWIFGNPTDNAFLEALFERSQPDEIYNLAAISRPQLSWAAPKETAEVNAFLPQAICELLFSELNSENRV